VYAAHHRCPREMRQHLMHSPATGRSQALTGIRSPFHSRIRCLRCKPEMRYAASLRAPFILCWCIATFAHRLRGRFVVRARPKLPLVRADRAGRIKPFDLCCRVRSVTNPAVTPVVPVRGRQTSGAEIISGRIHIRVPVQSAPDVPTTPPAKPHVKIEIASDDGSIAAPLAHVPISDGTVSPPGMPR
jgi:hypothetical protein